MKLRTAQGVWGLVIITLLLYLPTLFFPFIALDDAKHIWENPYVMHGSWDNIKFFWKSSYYGLYIPITYNFWIILAALTQKFNLTHPLTVIRADFFHLSQILLHTLNVFLLMDVARRLTHAEESKRPKQSTTRSESKESFTSLLGLVLIALPFALHPMQVESVAWASGVKDVLAGTFSLLATSLFIGRKNILFALGLAILAMLCKPSAVMISAAWLLLMWSYKDQLGHRKALYLLPLVIFGFWLAWNTKTEQPNVRLEFTVNLLEQVLTALLSLGFYLFKLILPIGLAPDYGLTPPAALKHHLSPIWIGLGLGLIGWAIWLIRHSKKRLVFSLLLIPLGLLPVLGFVPFEFQNMSTVADRYIYLWPMIGVGFFLHYTIRSFAHSFTSVPIITLVLGLIWGSQSLRQSFHWQSNSALFNRVLAVNAQSYLAHNNLGLTALREQRYPEAEFHLKKAIELKPNYLAAIANLGVLYFRQQKFSQVISHYQNHLQKLPPAGPGSPATFADIHYNLGASYINTGQLQDGKKHLVLATQINPNHFFARFHLGRLLNTLGEHQAAQNELGHALRIRPNDPQVLSELQMRLIK